MTTTIIRVLGLLITILGLIMGACSLMALAYGEEDLFAFLAASGVTIAGGAAMLWSTRRHKAVHIGHRAAFAIVTLGWLVSCLFGALPFYFYARLPAVWNGDAPARAARAFPDETLETSHADCRNNTGLGWEFCSYTNAVFETMSGFTTTGATILEGGLWTHTHSRAGGLPHTLLFWRAVTHFLGGMGIIVFGVALLPLLGVGGMQLFKAEVPGPVKDKVSPKITETARMLWWVYGGLTLLEAALLATATNQGWYLAFCHAFATMATGGFSPLAASVETLHSPTAEWIIAVFMLLAGANFGLHLHMFRRRSLRHFWRDDEFRFYLFLTGAVTGALTLFLWVRHGDAGGDALRTAFFQVLTILTTTGFSSTDFGQWAAGGQWLLMLLFFVGGCSGSTGGGVKCVRILVMWRLAKAEMQRLIHPRAVVTTRLSNAVVPSTIITSIGGFVVLYLGILLVASVVTALAGHDFVTAFTATGATLGNIGPGFGDVGPSANYQFFSTGTKWLQIVLMLLGRLELYSVIVLLTPEFWRK